MKYAQHCQMFLLIDEPDRFLLPGDHMMTRFCFLTFFHSNFQATKAHPMSHMLSSPDQIQLLQIIAKAIKAKKTLDIGELSIIHVFVDSLSWGHMAC